MSRPLQVTSPKPTLQLSVGGHTSETTDAHDATAISIVDSGGFITGTNVETALAEVAARKGAAAIGIIDGGGATITTGSKGFLPIPFACTIIAWRVVADASGSIVVDIKKATYSGLFTTSSIAASAKPTLSSARKNEDTTLTGWTTSVTAGDWLEFVVDSATTVQRVTVEIELRKT